MKISSWSTLSLVLLSCSTCDAYLPSSYSGFIGSKVVGAPSTATATKSPLALRMKLDLVTYLRTEWISAALCTNQTPQSADVVLQMGVEDGRAITFIPRTVREFVTSSSEPDGKVTPSARRQLKQQRERRSGTALVRYVDQRSDDLKETEDESVDVVISLQAAAVMIENGLDWKKSVREAARVLKPGGRLLFCEQPELEGESYVDYLATLSQVKDGDKRGPVEDTEDAEERFLIFEEGGADKVDLVLVPHIAGVAIKSEDAGLTPEERTQKNAQSEKDAVAELTINAFERGLKKRRKKKKKKVDEEEEVAEEK